MKREPDSPQGPTQTGPSSPQCLTQTGPKRPTQTGPGSPQDRMQTGGLTPCRARPRWVPSQLRLLLGLPRAGALPAVTGGEGLDKLAGSKRGDPKPDCPSVLCLHHLRLHQLCLHLHLTTYLSYRLLINYVLAIYLSSHLSIYIYLSCICLPI